MPNSAHPRATHRRLGFAMAGLAAAPLALVPAAVKAATAPEVTLEEVVVTATRRTETVQDVPLNITALGGQQLQDQGMSSLAEIMRDVPGFHVVNQGPRTSNRVVARGLNASPINSPEGIGNDAGGTVSTYIGEIPLYVDLSVLDLDRVEVLLGPQGTLYGAGTMGGAVRYIPRRPNLSATELSLNGSVFGLAHSSGVGTTTNAVLNLPLGETFAARAVVGYTDDPGFIDYGYLVREGGVSTPQPDFDDPDAVALNLRREKDADYLKVLAGRVGLRWQPGAAFDANLTYYFQDQKAGARTVNSRDAFGTDRYTSALRYLEPNDRENRLLALELEADLGFASLTSATGVSRYDERGQRDQTDLLITLEYSYEAFPEFTAFTLEEQEDRNFSQELRLVSQSDGPLQWIVGAYYNRAKSTGTSKEFVPGFDAYLGISRPDVLEYYSASEDDLEEMALFGELSWSVTGRWQVTVGGRRYRYDLESLSGFDLPLLYTLIGEYGPEETNLVLEPGGQKDKGTLWKFNTSFDFTDDVLGYFTLSEGYRIGNSNGVPPCPEPLPQDQQNVCGLPGEMQFFPDSTVNYELGLRSQWFDRRVTVNAAVYYIDWKDPQLSGATVNGSLPVTRNGAGAESTGLEVNFNARLTDRLRLWGNYAHANAKLSQIAPDLITTLDPGGGFGTVKLDGLKGDRLPGSPRHQGSLNLRYEAPLANGWNAGFTYGISAVSNVLTRTGNRGDGEALGGFAVNYASADLQAGPWSFALYADNLFDKYATTGVRGNRAYIQTVSDELGNAVPVRTYYRDVLRPREAGLRVNYDFRY